MRVSTHVPLNRPIAIAPANPAYPIAATDSSACRSSVRKIAPQSAAAPSPSVVHAVSRPNSTSRGVITRRGACSTGTWLGTRATSGRCRAATNAVTTTTTPARARWAPTASPSAAARAPRPAPHSPPTLKAPWKRGINGRSTATSMSWAAAFIDTSHVPYPNPTRSRAAPSRMMCGVRVATTNIEVQATIAVVNTRRRPNRSHNRLVSGIATTAPAAMASNAPPSSGSLASRCERTAGRRDTQLAKMNPLAKKAAWMAPMRARWSLEIDRFTASLTAGQTTRRTVCASPCLKRRRLR